MATWISNGAPTGTGSVQDMHDNHAANGDIIVIPSGSYTWSAAPGQTYAVNISKAVIVSCPTASITPSFDIGSPPTQSPPVVTNTPAVTITWIGTGPGSGWSAAFQVSNNAAGNIRIEGIKFQGPPAINSTYINLLEAGGLPVVINDCQFWIDDSTGVTQSSAIAWNARNGLVYNCWFNGGSNPGRGGGCCKIVCAGNNAWYAKSTFGNLDNGNNNIYFEQCQFDLLYNQGVDADDCARVVIRNSLINNCNFLTHGITSSWGGRQVEFYHNRFQYFYANADNPAAFVGTCPNIPNQTGNSGGAVNLNRYMWMRAGTARFWGNTVMPIWSHFNYGGASNAPTWQFIDEPCTNPGTGNGSVTESPSNFPTGNYPGTRWPGTGSDYAGSEAPGGANARSSGVVVSPSTVDPVYIWGNSDASAANNGYTNPNGNIANTYWGVSTSQTGTAFQLNRDLFLSAPPTTAITGLTPGTGFTAEPAGGYTPFVYPHPLNTTSSSGPPVAPVLTSVISGPTPSFVQANSFVVTATATTNSCPYTMSQLVGDCNLVWLWTDSTNPIIGVTDTRGNTYTRLYPATIDTTGQWQLVVFIANNVVAGANTVTATLTNSTWSEMIIAEYSSVAISNPSDVNSDNQGATGTAASDSITTVNAADLIVSWVGYGFPQTTETGPAGFNQVTFTQSPASQTGTSNLADLQVYAAGSYNTLWTLGVSKDWQVVNIALKSQLANPPAESSIQLSWNAVPNATSYDVHYGTTPGGPYPNDIPLGNVTSETINGLPAGTYYLVVTATNSFGTSPNSNQVSATIAGPPMINFGPGTLLQFTSTFPVDAITHIAPGTTLLIKPHTIHNAVIAFDPGSALTLNASLETPSLEIILNLVPTLSVPAIAAMLPEILLNLTSRDVHKIQDNLQPEILLGLNAGFGLDGTINFSPATVLTLLSQAKHRTPVSFSPQTSLLLGAGIGGLTQINAQTGLPIATILALLSTNLHSISTSIPIQTILSLFSQALHFPIGDVFCDIVLGLNPSVMGPPPIASLSGVDDTILTDPNGPLSSLLTNAGLDRIAAFFRKSL